jgi:hypothetical protein
MPLLKFKKNHYYSKIVIMVPSYNCNTHLLYYFSQHYLSLFASCMEVATNYGVTSQTLYSTKYIIKFV